MMNGNLHISKQWEMGFSMVSSSWNGVILGGFTLYFHQCNQGPTISTMMGHYRLCLFHPIHNIHIPLFVAILGLRFLWVGHGKNIRIRPNRRVQPNSMSDEVKDVLHLKVHRYWVAICQSFNLTLIKRCAYWTIMQISCKWVQLPKMSHWFLYYKYNIPSCDDFFRCDEWFGLDQNQESRLGPPETCPLGGEKIITQLFWGNTSFRETNRRLS